MLGFGLGLGKRILKVPAMKQVVLSVIRKMGLIEIADHCKFLVTKRAYAKNNRKFINAHPEFRIPPSDLAYDAYGHSDWTAYAESGRLQAEFFSSLIRRQLSAKSPIKICEWGCGPARIIRHLPGLLADLNPHIFGSDYNSKSIEWCKANIPDVDFMSNELEPPLPTGDGSFDCIYCYSVFTHLSAPMHHAWMQELIRVLKPGGIMIFTTHGGKFIHKLLADERKSYDQGELVVRGRAEEGKRCFTAFQPPSFVRGTLAKSLEEREHLDGDERSGLMQDVWVFRKPQ
jgi:SAM-dependent methyltransferase